jgi:hypothetical protein
MPCSLWPRAFNLWTDFEFSQLNCRIVHYLAQGYWSVTEVRVSIGGTWVLISHGDHNVAAQVPSGKTAKHVDFDALFSKTSSFDEHDHDIWPWYDEDWVYEKWAEETPASHLDHLRRLGPVGCREYHKINDQTVSPRVWRVPRPEWYDDGKSRRTSKHVIFCLEVSKLDSTVGAIDTLLTRGLMFRRDRDIFLKLVKLDTILT